MDESAVWVRVTGRGADDAADREALRAFVASVTGALLPSTAVGRRCPHCRGTDHGRPWATVDGEPVEISLARAPGAVALAVGPRTSGRATPGNRTPAPPRVDDGAIGVDLERRSRLVAAPLDDAFTPGELRRSGGDPAALTACWAAKEAVLKRDGRGLRVDPASVDVDLARGAATLGTAEYPVHVRWLDEDLVVAVSCTGPVQVEDHRGPSVVRDLAADDVDALQQLLESVPTYSERVTGYPPGPSDALSALITVPPGFDPAGKLGIGLWDGPELVAFADVLIGYPDPATAYIGLLVVHGRRHGQGLGRSMHDAVLARVRGVSGVERIRLGIVATNAAVAEPFWRALGYRPNGVVQPHRYDRFESTVALWERPVGSGSGSGSGNVSRRGNVSG
ncbi:hypothetical protein ASG04_14655 [Curtobacterium sp. Leaf183]|uniref:GNAT family N-acetyltransferase n=1 Tax=Curtobacterium sp. Leaf183 TaxID=1736291 RepID=UPI0006F850D5|nr:GNAT family N-acetyltransferase [Curtobacterium sp. Leaf183]KQS07375.1 hypothetical protein ASG04_14655 [Curtobacterium sp. Leaf183]